MATRRLSIYPNSQSFDDNLFEMQRNLSSLSKNLSQLNTINNNLLTFNKSFATFLQGLHLNSECLEFPEAPNEATHALAQRPMTPPPLAVMESAAAETSALSASKRHQATSISAEKPRKRVVIKTSSTGPAVKRRKPVFQTRRITDLLPSRFKEQPHKGAIEQVLKELNMNRDGMYAHEIVRDVGGGMTRNKCMDYMNALVMTEAVMRVNKKGHLFYLDPERFPQ